MGAIKAQVTTSSSTKKIAMRISSFLKTMSGIDEDLWSLPNLVTFAAFSNDSVL